MKLRDARSIAEQAECTLRKNGYLSGRDIRCTYVEGVLNLHGSVPSYYLKQLAHGAVAEVEGVAKIVNHIVVG